MDDAAVLRQQAAETLRSVEGMRRKTAVVGGRGSVYPLLAYAFAGLVGALFGVIERTPKCVYTEFSPGNAVGSCSSLPDIGLPMMIAISVGLFLAVVATEIHYQKQPVHPATPRTQISVPQAIIIAAIVIVLGPLLLGAALIAVQGAFLEGSGLFLYLLVSIFAIVQSRRIRNDALARAGAFAAFSLALAPFINTDFLGSIIGLVYAGAFLLAAAILSRRKAVTG